MQLLTDLTEGLQLLEPFLLMHGFEPDDYEYHKRQDGQFIGATYRDGLKKFHIGYSFMIGQVAYQYDNSKVYHDFYLEQLGLADRKRFNHFQSAETLKSFNYILQDFELLVEDFFKGQCLKLVEISKIQDKIITSYEKDAHEEFSLQFDKIRIDAARDEFGNKEFKKCIGIYNKVEHPKLFNTLDYKIIDYCRLHV